MTNSSDIKSVPESAWVALSQKRILFGHQSVGNNIVRGIKDILHDNPQIKLNIIENPHTSEVQTPGLIHFKIGRNTDPQSKLDEFANIMQQEAEKKPDIAFLKFCYVDFSANTDVSKIFAAYQSKMDALVKAFPQTRFIHLTVPLKSQATGFKKWRGEAKRWVKQLVSQPLNDRVDNQGRNDFNELLKTTYEGKAPIFDLAALEATYPNGKQEVFHRNGKSYFSLVPDYTNDGGHLNELGRKVVAEKLLVFLANLPD
ncbi:MAG TPA: hypothetical protein V6C95_21090 [Coleofasciculaceae cyanobacterium]